MEDQGIMALPQGMQAPTAQAPAPAVDPAAEAAFEQARMQMDPKEFGDEILAAGEQADPAAVQEFKQALMSAQLPPEIMDAIGAIVDMVLEDPASYQELRAELLSDPQAAETLSELLPPEFDAAYFGALNMALDQMSGAMTAPMEPQGFAMGGLVQTPVAAGIAQLGRNGDTRLAHITASEARMLRRRGGSGTINPATGLPEYWKPFKKLVGTVKKTFKNVGNVISKTVKGIAGAVKKFASSTIGKVVIAVALGFFLGPAAAGFLGVSSAAGVAAVSGFVGGFGSSMLAGGNLKDSLKAGAIGGITAGVTAGVTGGTGAFESGSYTGPTTISGQFDAAKEGLKSFVMGDPQAPAPITTATPVAQTGAFDMGQFSPADVGLGQTAAPGGIAGIQAPAQPTAPGGIAGIQAPTQAAAPDGIAGIQASPQTTAPSGFMDTIKQGYNEYIKPYTPGGIQEQGALTAQKAAETARIGSIEQALRAYPGKTLEQLPVPIQSTILENAGSASSAAAKAATPGVFSTYAPIAATGMGAAYLGGMFDPVSPEDLNIVPKETGSDLLAQYPEKYGTTPGGAQTVYAPNQSATDPYRFGAPPVQFRPSQYPTFELPQYAAMGGEIRRYAAGGIAALAPKRYNVGGYAGGGPGKFPRRTGPINGPGTGTSDSIPAMLSDGEFVMTAKAVRGAGGGSRREGAKRMYQMMHGLERKA